MIIGIFDSGSGGHTVEAEISKLLPDAKIIYLADTTHLPYGEKSPAELQPICEANVKALLAKGAQIIVVACNTATTAAIDHLRQKFPTVPIIGTEPAIKQACEQSSPAAKILLLATEATARSARTAKLIAQFKLPDQKVIVESCHGLASAIETHDQPKINAILSELSSALNKTQQQRSKPIETVILGCTHYPLIRAQIQAVFSRAKLIDGGAGVAREVARLAKNMV
ncbi:glutamate racemase [Candidatus Saccharibacteria bacterium]|nr:glutamate racemase [Candidatus Saccharibacteria bacterium]